MAKRKGIRTRLPRAGDLVIFDEAPDQLLLLLEDPLEIRPKPFWMREKRGVIRFLKAIYGSWIEANPTFLVAVDRHPPGGPGDRDFHLKEWDVQLTIRRIQGILAPCWFTRQAKVVGRVPPAILMVFRRGVHVDWIGGTIFVTSPEHETLMREILERFKKLRKSFERTDP
jgi:hypothetical protein